MERKGSAAASYYATIAGKQREQELERQLAEMERSRPSPGVSSASVAIRQRNQELERQLMESERSGASPGVSSASVAIRQRNQELERQLVESERRTSPSGVSSASVAIRQRNQELERQLAELEKSKPSEGLSTASVAIRRRNQELERQLVELQKGKHPGSSPGMSSASVAIHNRNQELERQLERLEKQKSASGRVLSSTTIETLNRNKELELKFAELSTARKSTGLSSARQQKVNARSIQLRKLISQSQELDLAFLVDVTGSMQPFIDSVKEKAPSIAAGVKKGWPQLKLRVAFAPYRDYEDCTRDDAEMCDFTDDFTGTSSVFVRALSRIYAAGGDDPAEDVFSGLERVASLSWKSRTRVLVHIGDAPCHGTQFHDLFSDEDRYPGGDAKGRDIKSLLRSLRDQCQIICYLFCHVNGSTKKMIRVFKGESDDANWIQEEKLANINRLADVVVQVSASSIARSVQVGDGSTKVVRKFVNLLVKPEMPLWPDIALEKASQIKYKLPDSLKDLFRALATNGPLEMEEMPDLRVQIAQYPFSGEGNLRWPYHAIVHQPLLPPRAMVLKRFKSILGEDVNQTHAKEAYFEQMEVQTVAAKLAQQFNSELDGLPFSQYKTVTFTLVSTLKVGGRYYNMERFLEGIWTRYSNNLNYVNTKEYAATLQAFSHWTYHRSEGLLMVTDLQGVEIEGKGGFKEFWLCDPSVHCKDSLRYEKTRTNWGEVGMRLFLEAHDCNNICRILRLPPTKLAVMRGSTTSRVRRVA